MRSLPAAFVLLLGLTACARSPTTPRPQQGCEVALVAHGPQPGITRSAGRQLTVGVDCAAWGDTTLDDPTPEGLRERIAYELNEVGHEVTDERVVLAVDAGVRWDRVVGLLEVLESWDVQGLELLAADGVHASVALPRRREVASSRSHERCAGVTLHRRAHDRVVVTATHDRLLGAPLQDGWNRSRCEPLDAFDASWVDAAGDDDRRCQFVVVSAEADRSWSEVAADIDALADTPTFLSLRPAPTDCPSSRPR